MEMLGNGYIYFGLFSILGLLIGGPLIDKINTKNAIYASIGLLIFDTTIPKNVVFDFLIESHCPLALRYFDYKKNQKS